MIYISCYYTSVLNCGKLPFFRVSLLSAGDTSIVNLHITRIYAFCNWLHIFEPKKTSTDDIDKSLPKNPMTLTSDQLNLSSIYGSRNIAPSGSHDGPHDIPRSHASPITHHSGQSFDDACNGSFVVTSEENVQSIIHSCQ